MQRFAGLEHLPTAKDIRGGGDTGDDLRKLATDVIEEEDGAGAPGALCYIYVS